MNATGDVAPALFFEINNGWDRFVYTFSTVAAANGDNPNVWLVRSRVYWSVEASLLFSILLAVVVWNVRACAWDLLGKEGEKEGGLSKGEGRGGPAQAPHAQQPERESAPSKENGCGGGPAREVEAPEERLQEEQAAPAKQVPPAAPKKSRLHYLDNLRVALIVCVFLLHTSEWMVGLLKPRHKTPFDVIDALLQPWFMPVFYFVSAYFTPASLERKGASWFVRDKLKRLGLPMLFVTLMWAPLRLWLIAFVTGKSYEYHIAFSVAWFLLWLLVFNMAYLALFSLSRREEPIQVGLPSDLAQLALGIAVGIVQTGIAQAQGGDWLAFGFLRMRWAYGPPCVCGFSAGILAARGGWLQTITEGGLRAKPVMLAASAGAAAGIAAVVSLRSQLPAVVSDLARGMLSGVLCVALSHVILAGFADWASVSNRYTRFLSRGSYAVYLLHTNLAVFPLTVVWGLIVRAAGMGDLAEQDFVIAEYWPWALAGGSFVAVLGLPLTFTVSWYLCKVPGLRDIV